MQGLDGGKENFKELSIEFSKNSNSKNCHHWDWVKQNNNRSKR